MIADYSNSPFSSSLRAGRISLSRDYHPGSTLVLPTELNDLHTNVARDRWYT